MEEIETISREDVARRGLTERLRLDEKNMKNRKWYLAYVAHPAGGTTIMEAYEIISESEKGYLVREVTEQELAALEARYSKSTGNGFRTNAHHHYRTG